MTTTTQKFETPILGIYPNTKGIGYALLTKPDEIIDAGVNTVSPICNEICMERIERYFTFYEPVLVVTRCDDPEATTVKRIKALIRRLKKLAEQRGIKIVSYDRQDIRNVFSQFGAKTKYEIAKTIVTWMPKLGSRMPKVRKPWMAEDYNMSMFDALSLIYTHYYVTD